MIIETLSFLFISYFHETKSKKIKRKQDNVRNMVIYLGGFIRNQTHQESLLPSQPWMRRMAPRDSLSDWCTDDGVSWIAFVMGTVWETPDCKLLLLCTHFSSIAALLGDWQTPEEIGFLDPYNQYRDEERQNDYVSAFETISSKTTHSYSLLFEVFKKRKRILIIIVYLRSCSLQ